jgi:hypothetical protein
VLGSCSPPAHGSPHARSHVFNTSTSRTATTKSKLLHCLRSLKNRSCQSCHQTVRVALRTTGLAAHGRTILSSLSGCSVAFFLARFFEDSRFADTLASGIGFWPVVLVMLGLFASGHFLADSDRECSGFSGGRAIRVGAVPISEAARKLLEWPEVGFEEIATEIPQARSD